MTIPATTIANYAPWGNAQLAFEVSTGVPTVDPNTGNTVFGKIVLEYLAALTLQSPNWQPQAGVDNTSYGCVGRLLSPNKLDPRIVNGSQAEAIINGTRGRFELVLGLNMDSFAYTDIRQQIEGVFRLVGGVVNG